MFVVLQETVPVMRCIHSYTPLYHAMVIVVDVTEENSEGESDGKKEDHDNDEVDDEGD